MTLIPCPHCNDKYFGNLPRRMLHFYDDEKTITFAMSRRDRSRICTLCGKAEALSDMTKTLDDEQARVAIGNDHQEALRLPAGIFHGVFAIPTGGLDEYIEQWSEIYDPE